MKLSLVIHPALSRCNVAASSKKQVLEMISRIAAAADQQTKYQAILDLLLQRERLGPTVIGHGIALPHAQVANLSQPLCIILSLQTPIEFDADEPNNKVDLIFGLFVPVDASEEHLNILAELSEKLKNPTYQQRLRDAKTNKELADAATEDLSATR